MNWKSYLDTSEKHFTIETESEITIEINPDDVTPEYLKGLKDIRYKQNKPGNSVMAR